MAWRTVALVAVGVALLALAYHLRHILNPLLIALGIAYVLQPLVVALEKRQIPMPGGRRPLGRTGATVVIFAVFWSMAETEQYFSSESRTASSTAFFDTWPPTV